MNCSVLIYSQLKQKSSLDEEVRLVDGDHHKDVKFSHELGKICFVKVQLNKSWIIHTGLKRMVTFG